MSNVGEWITESFDYDHGRLVTVYLPPDPPEAIVFAGDGQLISTWGVTRSPTAQFMAPPWLSGTDEGRASIVRPDPFAAQRTREGADLPPTMIVGTHRAADETLRLHEYSPPFDPERFAAHERFFVHDVDRWVRNRFRVDLPASRTAVFGVSAGGELALAIGLRHPDRYGAIFAASPGAGYQPPAVMPRRLPCTYLVAGTQEPFFLENATRWATALRGAGADSVVLSVRDAGHNDAMWREEFPLMVAWAFR